MKPSVIIPMYNEERYIFRCLESLQNQTTKDFEIILIDDWSSDNTLLIAEGFLSVLDLTILKQVHWWPWKARNLWANMSKWDILIFVDADMFFDEKFIENLIKPIIDWVEIWTAHWNELVWNLDNKLARAWSIIRCKYDKNNPRSGVYRAVKKDLFLTSWWFDSSKWYFDDDLSKLNSWKWALSVESAICYHNNPETLKEWFKHSIWVWKWLMQSWQIYNYLSKYKFWLILFFVFSIIIWLLLIVKWLFYLLPLFLFFIITFLIIVKTTQRAITEKYISHLFYIPLVLLIRWFWYFVWIFKYILKINLD